MDPAAKQQIVERVKQSENILVTVSNNPSIDQLASAIGLTLMLNKMGKSATAVYSGKTPSTLKFLQPEKTLETTTDSLRDFIVSLDKSKADKLRYKVEDQVVRIFITPYKTSLSEKDLTFSEGDFNVDLVVALGVEDRAHLDTTIAAHGRILHDATVISVNTKTAKASDIGQINWQDPAASSLSEMLVSISEAFGTGLFDSQIATAFLTGIVAETDRFSNKKTSPKVMTMSAQLMASGANQQLVISNLEPPPPPPKPVAPPAPPKPKPQPPPKPPVVPKPVAKAKAPATPKPKAPVPQPQHKKGELNVAHNALEFDSPEVEVDPNEIRIDQQGNLKSYDDYKKEEAKHPHPKSAPKPLALPVATPEEPQPTPQPSPEPLHLPTAPIATPAAPPPPMPPPPPPPPPPIPPAQNPHLPVPPKEIKSTPPPVTSTPSASATADDPHHAFIDPAHRPEGISGGYSPGADGQGWDDPSSSTAPVDPLNNASATSSDPLNSTNPAASDFAGHSKVINPPPNTHHSLDELLAAENAVNDMVNSTQPTPAADSTVDTARSAVESAYATAPFNPDLSPVTALNAQPIADNLNSPTPVDSANQSPKSPVSQAPATAPPPMPPPIPPIIPNANTGTPSL